MNRNVCTALLAAGLALTTGTASAASLGFGQTEANGCVVYIGEGAGQIVSDWGEEPLTTVGTVDLTSRDGEQQKTYSYETIFFPGVDAGEGGVRAHSGFENWRFVEGGARGTLRIRVELTPDDPTFPTSLALVGDGEMIGGNGYKTGGMHFVGTMDYWTGAYVIDLFELVLCRNQ